jgi:hypothetical protein
MGVRDDGLMIDVTVCACAWVRLFMLSVVKIVSTIILE